MSAASDPASSTWVSAPGGLGGSAPDTLAVAQGRILGSLRAAQLFGGIGQAAGGSAGALLARQISGSDARAGWPQACLTAGAAVAAIVVSAVAHRTTRRSSLAGALGMGAVGAATGAVSAAEHSLVLLLVGSVMLGAGNAAVMLSRYAATDLARPEHRGRAIAAVLVATSLGAVGGANLLGVTAPIASSLGLPQYVGPYLAAAAAYAVAGQLVLLRLRPDPLTLARQRSPSSASLEGRFASPRRLLLPRHSAVGLLTVAVANMIMVGLMALAPLELVAMGQGLGIVGMTVSLHIAAMFALSPVSGRLVDWLGEAPAALIGNLLMAGAALTATVDVTSQATLTVALILLGAGWNVAVVAGSAMLIAAVAPQRRPRLEATGEVGMGLAGAVGSAMAGPLVLAWGYDGPGFAFAGVSAAAALMLLVESRRSQLRRRHVPGP